MTIVSRSIMRSTRQPTVQIAQRWTGVRARGVSIILQMVTSKGMNLVVFLLKFSPTVRSDVEERAF